MNCQIPRCRRRHKPLARIEMNLPSARNFRGKHPSDGRCSLKSPTQGRESPFQRLAGSITQLLTTRASAGSAFLPILPSPPTILSLFATRPCLEESGAVVSQMAQGEEKSKVEGRGSGKEAGHPPPPSRPLSWSRRLRLYLAFKSRLAFSLLPQAGHIKY